jgi:hypothetical protein
MDIAVVFFSTFSSAFALRIEFTSELTTFWNLKPFLPPPEFVTLNE